MKKIILLLVALLVVIMLPGQGIYQLWGITAGGGAQNTGTIFSTNAAGNDFRIRYQFQFSNPGGDPQYTEPVEYNNKFYGMTLNSLNGQGAIFEWDPSTNVYTQKHEFDHVNGSSPYGSLALYNGKFYGMTTFGGINAGGSSGDGVIFEWDPVTNVYTKKFDFGGTNGIWPYGNLTQFGGKLYGMTNQGGSNNFGVIFEWDPATNVYTKKIDLDGINGSNPLGSLTLSGDKFYGMTGNGGISGTFGEGVIFAWDPVTNVYTKKVDLFENSGSHPFGNLTQNGGKFYGMTEAGGNDHIGVIFEWDTVTNVYTKKIDFDSTNGYNPTGSLTLDGGKFFGMTGYGGSNDFGVIFEWDPATNAYTKKIDFNENNGRNPLGSLTLRGGKLYGMTSFGGSGGQGVIFEWDPGTNLFSQKIDFSSNNTEGTHPSGNLTQSNGKFYGITGDGGNNNSGVIFEWDPGKNVYTKKIEFSKTNGYSPCGNLSLFDGKLYGMTSSGGSSDLGVIFEWDPATNVYTKKFDFSTPIGSNPSGNAGLSLKGQKFYGMTTLGGSTNDGVIFEWDPVTNVYIKKIDFSNDFNFNGAQPASSLTLNGSKFYGLTTAGGIHGGGVIFEWDPETNVYTKKFDFLDNGQFGLGPRTNLILSEGKFYGVTELGGINKTGVIFEWDPGTNVYAAKINLDSTNGSSPQRSLTLSGSRFYGMTALGGINNLGVIFEWDPVTNVYSKKKDFNGTDGAKPFGNSLILSHAPVANGLAGSCVSFPAVTIDNSNKNVWVPVLDDEGNAVAEIKANGNNLGIVSSSLYINNAAVREDGNKKLYLDRNITITPAVQPTSPVDIRLYIKGSEFLALKNALNSNGDSSGITSINDIAIYKNGEDCSAAVSAALTNPLVTTADIWQDDYVFTANISSFSTFYFANKAREACPGPVIQCSSDTVVNATANRCGAEVKYKAPVVTDACENVTLEQTAGLHSGAFFPVGVTINKFIATGTSGQKDSCSFTVTVKDNKPPFITPVFAFPAILWPPNHKLKSVSVNYFAWDNCGEASCSLDVSSNEPVMGTGYGDKAPDWEILNNHRVKLRAERSGSGDGRVYTITVTCTDASGNSSTQKTRVFVPHQFHEHHSKGLYNFDDENDAYTEDNGDYIDHLLDGKVSPNPSRESFNLEIKPGSGEKIEVNLYDITGRFISKLGPVKSNTLRFGNDLKPGIYMLQIKQGQQQKMIKVIKQ